MKTLQLAVLVAFAVAHSAPARAGSAIFGAGPLSGGATQFASTCNLANIGTVPVAIVEFAMVDQTGANLVVGNNCAEPLLAPGHSCDIRSSQPLGALARVVCSFSVSGSKKALRGLRGTLEVRDVDGALLSVVELR